MRVRGVRLMSVRVVQLRYLAAYTYEHVSCRAAVHQREYCLDCVVCCRGLPVLPRLPIENCVLAVLTVLLIKVSRVLLIEFSYTSVALSLFPRYASTETFFLTSVGRLGHTADG